MVHTGEDNKDSGRYHVSGRQGPKSFLEHPNNIVHLAKVCKEKEKETKIKKKLCEDFGGILTTEYLLDGKGQVHCLIYITEHMNE